MNEHDCKIDGHEFLFHSSSGTASAGEKCSVRCQHCGKIVENVGVFVAPPAACKAIRAKIGPVVGSSYAIPDLRLRS